MKKKTQTRRESICWSKLSDNDRLKEMRRIAKEEASRDGVFYVAGSHRLIKAMEFYGVSIEKLIEGTGLNRAECAS